MSFLDRADAGKRLGAALMRYRDDEPVILALPRGGVPVALEVARALDAPLDLLIVRKIGVPQQPELAAGAVVDATTPIVVRNDAVIGMARLSEVEFDRIKDAEIVEIERRRRRYLGERPQPVLKGRTVIVVDDGIATGATMRAALRALRLGRPRRLVLATPVAPIDTIEALRDEADEIECLETHAFFGAIGNYYKDFRQVSDEQVVAALEAAALPRRSSPA